MSTKQAALGKSPTTQSFCPGEHGPTTKGALDGGEAQFSGGLWSKGLRVFHGFAPTAVLQSWPRGGSEGSAAWTEGTAGTSLFGWEQYSTATLTRFRG